MTRLLTLLLSGFSVLFANAQDFSNKGKDFYIPYAAHIDGTGSAMGIYITSDQTATGTIKVGATTLSFTVTAGTVVRKFIGSSGTVDASNASVYLSTTDNIVTGAAIHVVSDKPVAVYAHIVRTSRSGASLVLPVNVWGREYIAPSYQNTGGTAGSASYGEIDVMAAEANTLIEITPATTTFTNRPAGVPYTITLANPGDVYQVQFKNGADLSGTKIRSISTSGSGCKPIGVFSASTWSAFSCTNASGGDNLYQQLFPIRTWGKQFLTAPFINRPSDIIRVFVSDPATAVTKTENGVTTTLSGLVSNAFYEYSTANPTSISANNPISVIQYITSQNCKSGCATNTTTATCWADPEMVVLNPVEQTINNITVFSAHQNSVPAGQSSVTRCFLNIVIKTAAAASFKINGATPSGAFVAIPGTNFSYLQADVSTISASNPVQTLSADSSFSAIAYGYGNVESYGYNAGTNVKDLFQFVSITNQYATVNFPSTCVNTPFLFSITLPYQATSLLWDFHGAFANVNNAAPVPDSSFVRDGRTLYVYKMPNTTSFSAVGTFPISVFATNPTSDGCSGINQIDYDVEVFPKPFADWNSVQTGCVGDSVSFFDATNGLGRPTAKWKWEFGDNTVDSVKNPKKKFATAGTFNVHLLAITDVGCFADTTKPITISNPPIAKFGVSTLNCPGTSITFTDSSTISAGGTIVKFYWDDGNGHMDSVTSNSPRTFTYPSAGTYVVKLYVKSSTGCVSNLFTYNLVVHAKPVVDFTMPSICLPEAGQFFDQTTIADGTQGQLHYSWNFGDGGTDTVKNPVHIYASAVSFPVKLIVTSVFGCIDSASKSITTVHEKPIAGFTAPTEVCLRDTITVATAYGSTTQFPTKIYFDYGDGTIDSVGGRQHLYMAAGTYTIKHYYLTNFGCRSDTATKTITVNALPIAQFITSAPSCETKGVTITDQSIPGAGNITNWFWSFGDATISNNLNGNPFQHVYAAAGTYQIKLFVSTNKGCKADTLTKTITINEQPKAAFILPEVCLSDAYAVFTDSSYIAGGSAASFTYAWNFGDANATIANPNTSTLKNPQHKYSATGTYQIKLTVTSNKGCSDTLTKQLVVNGDIPVSNFNILNSNSLCSNIPVTIENKSTVNFGVVTKTEVYWDWANNPAVIDVDNTPVANKTYSHQYPNFQTPITKTVQIRFLAYSGGVCVDDSIKTITLNASPKVVFGATPGICLGAAAQTIAGAIETSGLPGTYTYTGTGINASNLFDPTISGAGTFSIKYLYVSNAGCKDSVTGTQTVWPRPIADFMVSSPTCEKQAITFTDQSIPSFGAIKQWKWQFGDATVQTNNSAVPFTHVYNAVATYAAGLQVVTDSGCISLTTPKAVIVHPLPVVNFSVPAICLPPGTATFVNSSSIADASESQFTQLWNFGETASAANTSTAKDGVHNYTTGGPFQVTLTTTSKDGCVTTKTQTLTDISAQPKAAFDILPPFVCLGDAITFTDLTTFNNQTLNEWHWDFGDNRTSTLQNTTHTYSSAGNFQVKMFAKSNKGCLSDTAVKQVIIYPYPVVNAGPDQFVLEGGQAQLMATVTGASGYSYLWTPATYLNIDSVLQPITKPISDINYHLEVTAAGGCSRGDDVFVKVLLAPVIPNAFSPNKDGINDVWNIQYLNSYPGATIQIFDRYGKLVFSSVGYTKPFDGKLNGTDLAVGVYYYVVDPKNGRRPMTGSLTLLR